MRSPLAGRRDVGGSSAVLLLQLPHLPFTVAISMVERSAATFSATSPPSSRVSTPIQIRPLVESRRSRTGRSCTGAAWVPARVRAARGSGAGDGAHRAVRPLGGAQLGRRRTWVLGALLRAGNHGAGRERAQRRAVAAHADGKVGRAGAAAGLVADEPLDDPILERVEADHGHAGRRAAAGRAAASSPSRSDSSSSLVAIRSAWNTRLAGWPWPNRLGVGMAHLDHVDQVAGAIELPRLAAAHDRAGDLTREPLLAEVAEDRGEPALVPGVDDVGGGEVRATRPCACRAARRWRS